MSFERLADGIVRLLGTSAYGVHHMAAAGQCSWYEFARAIFRQAGIECRVAARTTEEFGRPAPRPPFSVLRSERHDSIDLPAWQSGLAAYLDERAAIA